MNEQSYPIQSQCCQKTLYGPVLYCPYCGTPIQPAADEKPYVKLSDDDKQQGDIQTGDFKHQPQDYLQEDLVDHDGLKDNKNAQDLPSEEIPNSDKEPVLPQKPPVVSKGQGEKIEEPEKEPKEGIPEPTINKVKPPKRIRVIMIPVAAVIIGLIVYAIFHSKNPPPIPPTSPPPIARESLISEALHQGVQLSVVINMISKQENLVSAAKKLLEISPTNPEYKKQLDSAESKLSELSDNKDRVLKLYADAIMQLRRSNQKEISFSIESIKEENLSNREKLVMDLLLKHVNSLSNGGKPDQNTWLSDFTQNFSNFND